MNARALHAGNAMNARALHARNPTWEHLLGGVARVRMSSLRVAGVR
jgi:hypothetical protein